MIERVKDTGLAKSKIGCRSHALGSRDFLNFVVAGQNPPHLVSLLISPSNLHYGDI